MIANPRVLQTFAKYFPKNNLLKNSFDEHQLTAIINQHYNVHPNILIKSNRLAELTNISPKVAITKEWTTNYKTRIDSINTFFNDQGIIRKESTNYTLTNLNIIAFGYRSPFILNVYFPKRTLNSFSN